MENKMKWFFTQHTEKDVSEAIKVKVATFEKLRDMITSLSDNKAMAMDDEMRGYYDSLIAKRDKLVLEIDALTVLLKGEEK